MRHRFALRTFVSFLLLVSSYSPASGDTSAPNAASLFAQPQKLQFPDLTIGTLTSLTLIVVNNSDKAASPSLKIIGENPEDTPSEFGANSKCLNSIPAKQACDITVTFAPVTIAKVGAEKRHASLVLSDESGPLLKVPLDGNAFQTVTVSPNSLEFEAQIGNTANVQRTVQVTNFTSSALSSIMVSATGDFTENHAACAGPINSGGSCAVSVAFAPKLVGGASGSLTITANSAGLGQIPRVVSLHGEALNKCKLPPFSFKDLTFRIVMGVCAFYFLGLILVRWHMIAKPARQQIVAEIEIVRSRAIAETAWLACTPETQVRLERIHALLDQAIYPFKHKGFPDNAQWRGRAIANDTGSGKQEVETSPKQFWGPTRVFNALFWSRGHELSSWTLAHEAEVQLADMLPLERTRARLESAEQELRKINTPLAISAADRVHESLAMGDAQLLDRAQQLLQQLNGLLKPQSVQKAARELWLADLQRRINDILQKFGAWVQKSAGTVPASMDECKARLQDLITSTNSLSTITADLKRIPASDPDLLPTWIKDATSFVENLAQKIADAAAKLTDTALAQPACNDSVSSLTALGAEAARITQILKAVPSPDQTQMYKTLADLCRSQSSLIGDLAQATAPNPRVTLLVDVLAALQQQKDCLQTVTQADVSAVSADLGNHRDVILKLASTAPLSSELIGKINCVLLGEVPAPLGRWRALLHEALDIIYENVDEGYFQLISWHNKMIWLVGCALLFIFVLAVSLGNPVLLLVGAVGGLMSRLTRTSSSSQDNDSGATWGSLFLSPLTGAFCAWGGILLIILGVKLNIFGAALTLDWCNPYESTALAIALLFGFLERLFDTLTGQIQDKLTKTPAPVTPTSTPSPSSPSPKITSPLSPASATLGKEVQITVTGTNFKSGATATLTSDTGDPVRAKQLEYKSASLVVVTCTPTGSKPFKATLTISNPDGQSDTAKLDVTAP